MFTFAWGVYTSLFSDHVYKVLIIGLESSGKTTLMEQLKCTYAERRISSSSVNTTPTPAPLSVMQGKRIRPTVGLNTASITHRTIPEGVIGDSTWGGFCSEEDAELCDASTSASPSVSISATATTPTATRLMLWDVGGSLLTLWANYFAPCHGVIFLVDSTLGATTGVSGLGNSQVSSLASHPIQPGGGNEANALDWTNATSSLETTEKIRKKGCFEPQVGVTCRCQARRESYAQNAAVLREVFCHPLLTDAPLLIMSNKVDVEDHCPMAELQDALQLLQMALIHELYDGNIVGDSSLCVQSCKCSKNGPDNLSASVSFSSRSIGSTDVRGTSGIGKKVLRMVEVSALYGTGVREAMDWLTIQMRDSKRKVVVDGG